MTLIDLDRKQLIKLMLFGDNRSCEVIANRSGEVILDDNVFCQRDNAMSMFIRIYLSYIVWYGSNTFSRITAGVLAYLLKIRLCLAYI